jgi:DNA replication protein DnaC
MFMLVSRRYERASLVVTSNKPFSAWGEICGDQVTAAAMSQAGFDGGLESRILSLREETLRRHGPCEEVPR